MVRAGPAAAIGGAILLAVLAFAAPALAQTPAEIAAGKRLVQWKCASCHRVVRATERRHTRSEWEATVSRMIQNGADVKTDQERQAIVAYLVSLNTPESP